MVNKEIELCYLEAFMVQFDVVSYLVGNLFYYLEKSLLDLKEGTLSHEAKLNLLSKVNMPNQQFYVYTSELGLCQAVPEEILCMDENNFSDLTFFFKYIKWFTEGESILSYHEGLDVSFIVENYIVNVLVDIADIF